MRLSIHRRAASGMTYALMLGLVAVVAIGAVARLGGGLNGLMLATGNRLSSASNGVAPAFPPPAPDPFVALVISGSGSGMNVTASGTPSYGTPVVFTVSNTGTLTSSVPTVDLGGSTNFEITANSCTAALGPGGSCQVTIRPVASANGSLTASLTIQANNTPSIGLSGTASGFVASLAVTGNGSGMNVTGPGNPAYGVPVVFTVTNNGSITSATPTADLGGSTNFEFTANTCTAPLAPAGSCQVTIRPKATADGSYSATLTINANNAPTASLAGVASNFSAALTMCKDWYNAGYTTNGNYLIDPDGVGGAAAFSAVCDMTTTPGGWTVLIADSSTTLTYMRQFPRSLDTIATSLYTDATKGIGWGTTNSTDWGDLTKSGVRFTLNYYTVRITYSGSYNTPSGGLGELRVRNGTSELLLLTDSWTNNPDGQSLYINGATIFNLSQTNVVNRTDEIPAASSTSLLVKMNGYTTSYAYTQRFISRLMVR